MSAYGIGNHGHYRGDTMQEIIDRSEQIAQDRYIELAENLAALVGYDQYDAWVDKNIHGPWSANVKIIEHELDRLECSCTPNHDPCSGCQRLSELRRIENVQR